MKSRVVGTQFADVRKHGSFWHRETITDPECDQVTLLELIFRRSES